MKMNLKKLSAKADNDVFDEIISKCESKMASPFKKESEPEEVEESMEVEEPMEEPKEHGLSPEDLEKLLEMYNNMKG
jgi:hypothetical protein